MKQVNQVFETTDYSVFSFIPGNRETNALHIERLKRSFLEKRLFSPIIVNEKYQIIDGQHRFSVCKMLELPIIFIVAHGYGLKEVQMLNTNSSTWKMKDFLDGYCKLGYSEYLKMKQFMLDYPEFSIKPAEILLSNLGGGSNNQNTISVNGKEAKVKNFEQGRFKVFDLNLARANAEKILDFKPYYDGYNRAVFVNAMIGLFKNENYDHEVMLQKLKANPTVMKHCGNVSQYRELVEDIYNFRNRNKVNLRF